MLRIRAGMIKLHNWAVYHAWKKCQKVTINPTRNLTLAADDKKVAGIAGGIAEYYNLSPVWVRIVGIVIIVLSGIIPGLLIYFIIATAIRRGESKLVSKCAYLIILQHLACSCGMSTTTTAPLCIERLCSFLTTVRYNLSFTTGMLTKKLRYIINITIYYQPAIWCSIVTLDLRNCKNLSGLAWLSLGRIVGVCIRWWRCCHWLSRCSSFSLLFL